MSEMIWAVFVWMVGAALVADAQTGTEPAAPVVKDAIFL